jgi:hypothetical protein
VCQGVYLQLLKTLLLLPPSSFFFSIFYGTKKGR